MSKKTVNLFNKLNFDIAGLLPKEHRYAVIHVTNDFTEVTNGHYLVRIDSVKEFKEDDLPERDGKKYSHEPLDVCIDPGVALEIKQAIPKNERTMKVLNHTWPINVEKESVEFLTTNLISDKTFKCNVDEQKFFDTNQALQRKKEIITISFNVEYMSKICSLIAKAGIKGMTMTIQGEKEPMFINAVQIETGQKIQIVLMPMIV